MSTDDLLRLSFSRSDLPTVRAMVTESLFRAGVNEPVRCKFVQAALEIVCNAVVHGGGFGRLVLRLADGELWCEVTDHGEGPPDDLPSRRRSTGMGSGLRLAEALTGRVELHRGPDGQGTTATVAVRLEPAVN